MKLRVLTPTALVLDEPIQKLRGEAANGCFGMWPHHVDTVTALVPSVLSYVALDGSEGYVAVDEGILVKCGEEVRVSVRRAAVGELEHLAAALARELRALDQHERQARSALARLEAAALRRLAELGDVAHG